MLTGQAAAGTELAGSSVDLLEALPQVALTILAAAAAVAIARFTINRVSRTLLSSASRVRALRRHRAGTPLQVDPAAVLLQARLVQRAKTVAALFRSLTTFTIAVVAAVSILNVFNVDIGRLLTAAGVLGVILGFGAQTLIKDMLSGLFMVLEEQYGAGDFVDVGTVAGTVESIGLRVTQLRADDGTLWYVRNGEVQRLGNKTQGWSRAVVEFKIGYDDDIDLAQATLLAAAANVVQDARIAPWVLDEPQVLGIEDLTAESVLLRLKVKTVPSRQWEVARQLRAAARVALSDAGISLAPTGPALLPPAEPPAAPEPGQDTAALAVLAPAPAPQAHPPAPQGARRGRRGRRPHHR